MICVRDRQVMIAIVKVVGGASTTLGVPFGQFVRLICRDPRLVVDNTGM